jgi:hypothetical protein
MKKLIIPNMGFKKLPEARSRSSDNRNNQNIIKEKT